MIYSCLDYYSLLGNPNTEVRNNIHFGYLNFQMIEEDSFFNYGASLNDTYQMFISFKGKKPRDNAQIINVE